MTRERSSTRRFRGTVGPWRPLCAYCGGRNRRPRARYCKPECQGAAKKERTR